MKHLMVFLALLTGGCVACAPRQNIHIGGYDAPVVSMPLDTATHMEAATKCDKEGRPVIVVSTYAQETQLYYTIEHEKTHVRQMERLGLSCRDFTDKYNNDEKFKFQMEAEAYCAGFMLTVYMRDYNYSMSYPHFVMFLSTVFPKMTYKEIWETLPCKPLSGR